jgi:site-specific DNA-methyltransferase (adenine-specific)
LGALSYLYVVPEGSIILDSFAGSGTTLVAAKNTGRQFIGIEKGKESAAVAGERLCMSF